MRAKPRAVATAEQEVAVAVTDCRALRDWVNKKHRFALVHLSSHLNNRLITSFFWPLLCLGLLCALPGVARAEVLPDERIDVLYHSYDGGGTKIDGPAVLIRKNIGSAVSVSGQYYVDTVSGASIDVQALQGVDAVSGASRYSEERKQTDLGMVYLHERTTMSLGYSTSQENDYDAETYSFGISQTFFGDLTTINLGVSVGQDVVGKNTDPTYERQRESYKYRVGLTQILSKNLIASINLETISDRCVDIAVDESCLNNPYRMVRYADPGTARGYSWQSELYPHTHNSDAVGIRAVYYLPYRAALRAEYREFSDSWGIDAHNYELRYTHPYGDRWIFEAKYRAYEQNAADFYSDLFPYRNAQNFLARDKELSALTTTTFGAGVSYLLPPGTIPWFSKSSVNLYWDRMQFDYDNFRNVLAQDLPAGEEPLYGFEADIIRFYLSFWF